MSHSLPKLRVSLLVTIGAAALLAGCDTTNLSRTFGLTRDAPDEFSVSTRAPLSMPPNNALRAPRPGASRPQELSSRAAAEATLSPGAVLESSTNTSPGQLALVQASGRPAAPDIRAKIDSDNAGEQTDRSFADRLLFWKSREVGPGVAVDPTLEAQRLRTNAALGQDTLAGETPIIQPKRKNWWDWLF
jgi:hypothetical protein